MRHFIGIWWPYISMECHLNLRDYIHLHTCNLCQLKTSWYLMRNINNPLDLNYVSKRIFSWFLSNLIFYMPMYFLPNQLIRLILTSLIRILVFLLPLILSLFMSILRSKSDSRNLYINKEQSRSKYFRISTKLIRV